MQYLRKALEEGFKERKKLNEEPAFAAMRELPEFKELKTADGKPAKVTIRHLLTHTSGMGEITADQARACKTLTEVIPLYVARPVGAWALAIGAMRYAFVAAMWVLPWMRRTLPPRYWRKVVAATQGIVLVVATAGVLPRALAAAALAAALALLVESFGRDVVWLWQCRVEPGVVRGRLRAEAARQP